VLARRARWRAFRRRPANRTHSCRSGSQAVTRLHTPFPSFQRVTNLLLVRQQRGVSAHSTSRKAEIGPNIQGAKLPITRRAACTARLMSVSLVCQLHTETRMQRLPRHVVLPKKASPVATILAVVSSVQRS
jgi:hypothetical protein